MYTPLYTHTSNLCQRNAFHLRGPERLTLRQRVSPQLKTNLQFLTSYFPACLLSASASQGRGGSALCKPFNETSVLIWAQMRQGKFDVPLNTGVSSLFKSSVKPFQKSAAQISLGEIPLTHVRSIGRNYSWDKWGNGDCSQKMFGMIIKINKYSEIWRTSQMSKFLKSFNENRLFADMQFFRS